jgi:hypothetical protein
MSGCPPDVESPMGSPVPCHATPVYAPGAGAGDPSNVACSTITVVSPRQLLSCIVPASHANTATSAGTNQASAAWRLNNESINGQQSCAQPNNIQLRHPEQQQPG